MIYFDNGSTSFPKAPGVGKAMADFLDGGAYNINRGGYAGAYDMEQTVLETRVRLCSFFGAENPRHVVFTGGITASLNLFILGYLKKGDHVIATSMEHNAVLRPLRAAERRGIEVSFAQAGSDGLIRPEEVERLMKRNTRAVVMLHGSNVNGAIQPIDEIGRLCRGRDAAFAVDTAQTAGTLPIQMEKSGIDFLAFSGHKGLLGPQGIGGFLVSQRISEELEPVFTGGTGSYSQMEEQPRSYPDRFESGTLNLPGMIGLNRSLHWLEQQDAAAIGAHKAALAERFCRRVEGFSHIAGETADKRLGVVSLTFDQADPAQAAYALDEKYGIMTRVGLHCAPLAHKTLGTYPEGTVRFSFGMDNTEDEVDFCAEALKKIVTCDAGIL